MRLSYSGVSDRISLVHKHPVDLTARHWKKTTSGEPRVFSPPCLSNHLSAGGVGTKTDLTFHLSQGQTLFYAQSYLAREGNASRSDGQMCTWFALSRSFLRELRVSFKRQRTAAWKPKQHAQWTLSVSRHRRANVQCAPCVRARLCTLAKAPRESKCLMG